MSLEQEAIQLHRRLKGKLSVVPKIKVSKNNLHLLYTPGVGEIVKLIAKDKRKAHDYTIKGNSVAVVTDGSSVLGLGNMGAEAALPVMEGKALLFKAMANIDAFPICLNTQDVDEIVKAVTYIAPVFGGVNLEDISAPRCFEIEKRLQDIGIPVMHDDQHGTAVVVLAALLNAAKVVHKKFGDLRVVVNGAGAAGTAISKLLACTHYSRNICTSVKELIVCDSKGSIYKGRGDLQSHKEQLADMTNKNRKKGSLSEMMEGADVFIGVSRGNIVHEDMIKRMAKQPIVFALSNPIPEIMPDKAKKGGAAVIATGRSDFPNQVNNVLAFPGIFRGALDACSERITDAMKLQAAHAIAGIVKHPTSRYILPSVFDKKVVASVAQAVKKAK